MAEDELFGVRGHGQPTVKVVAPAATTIPQSFIDCNCFSIPMRKWLDILAAIKADIAEAKVGCGGDGLGCAAFRGYYGEGANERRYSKCGQCPMAALSNIREAVNDYL